MSYPAEVLARAAAIKLFVTDADGVWTDGLVVVHANGDESLRFSVQDGLGVRALLQAGAEIVIVSGRSAPALQHRANRLGVTEVLQGIRDKREVVERLLSERGLDSDQVAAMGDDLPDLDLFACAGLCIAPRNAVPAVRDAADYITTASGGGGALREACELLVSGHRAAAAS